MSEPYAIKMPKLSDTMTEGTVITWEKPIGEKIARNTVVATVETDKAIMDVEVFREGFLSGPIAPVNSVIKVGEPIAFLVADEKQVKNSERKSNGADSAEPTVAEQPAAPAAQPAAPMPELETVTADVDQPAPRPQQGHASPYARKLAAARGIDLNALMGASGKDVLHGIDVLAAKSDAAAHPHAATGNVRPMDGMEKAVAQSMSAATQMPLFRVSVNVAPQILAAQAKENGISLTVALAKAAALAIAKHPKINALYQDGGRILEREQIDVGIAVETEGMGLVVPVLRDVLRHDLAILNKSWKDLVARARTRHLKPEEYTNGTFTISNMGMLGVSYFDAIPTPNTSAIFAISTTGPQGMPVTLTSDHRVINGADAAKFMNTFKMLVENPDWLSGQGTSGGTQQKFTAPKGNWDYDVVVIGGGPGGEDCARDLAQSGKKVALVNDAAYPGGECLWRGCIPSKTWRAAADRIRDRLHDAHLGVQNKSAPNLNWKQLEKTRRDILETRGDMALKTDKGVRINYQQGFARFTGPNEIEVSAVKGAADPHTRTQVDSKKGKRITFGAAVIATGAPPFVPPIPGADSKGVLTSDTVWSLKNPPKKLGIIGAGAIGLEMAQIFADFGTQVLVVEAQPRALAEVEEEVAKTLTENLTKQKNLKLITGAKVAKISGKPGTMTLQYEAGKGEKKTFRCDVVLLATGKRPQLDPLALDKAGIRADKSIIPVNEYCQTNVSHIFAIGDVNGGYMLAHTAAQQGRVAAGVLLGEAHKYEMDKDCGVIFTRPQAAFVGLSATQAKTRGIDAAEIKVPLSIDAKAMINNETVGLIKLVADKKTQRIIGVHLLADHADTLIGEAVLMVSAGLTLQQVAHAIHPHPTQTEIFGDLARRLAARLKRTAKT